MRWRVNAQPEEAALLMSKQPENAKPPKTLNPQSHSCNSRSRARNTGCAASTRRRRLDERQLTVRTTHTQDRQGGTGFRRWRWRRGSSGVASTRFVGEDVAEEEPLVLHRHCFPRFPGLSSRSSLSQRAAYLRMLSVQELLVRPIDRSHATQSVDKNLGEPEPRDPKQPSRHSCVDRNTRRARRL